MELTNKTAIITGGGSGIGEATALLFARRGANVIVNYSKSQAAAEDVARRCAALGVKALAVQADVGEDSDCRRLAEEAKAATGRIDILVNNAGTTKFSNNHADLDGVSGDDFLDIYKVNVVGAYQMIRACAPAMRAQGWGAIVNVSSIAGVYGVGSSSAYAASKGALITLTKSMARALAPEIRVNAVCPGFVGTGWFKNQLGEEKFNALVANVAKITPLRHAGTAEDMAEGVVFFCSGGAATITGETLLMDAGAHLDLFVARPRE